MDKPENRIKFRDHRELLRGSTSYKPEPPKCNCIESLHLEGAVLCPDCAQPNSNAMIIKAIQGLMTCATGKIGELSDKQNTRAIRCKAIEEIDLFEKTTLFELQKEFE